MRKAAYDTVHLGNSSAFLVEVEYIYDINGVWRLEY